MLQYTVSDHLKILELCFIAKNGLLKNEEKYYFQELTNLYNNADEQDKKFIANELQYTRVVATSMVNAIIYDQPHIAENFLRNSPSLSDEKLISFIKDNLDVVKLHYIAARREKSEKLKNLLFQHGDKQTREILENKTFKSPTKKESSNIIITRSKNNMLSRQFFELNTYNLSFQEISKHNSFQIIKEELDKLSANTLPNYTFLIRYLCKGMPLSFLYLLSKKSDISFSTIYNSFMKESNPETMVEFLRKSNMPYSFCLATVELFLIILNGIKSKKLTPGNLKTRLLSNVKQISRPEITREIAYIERMI